MASTYTPIATTTLGSAASSVTFSSISSTYTDLRIVYATTASADAGNYIRYNSDSGSNYSRTNLYGNGSSAGSDRQTTQTGIYGPFTMSSAITANTIEIMNYSNSTTYKTCLVRAGAANNSTLATVGLWRSTAAITSVSITCDGANFVSGSTFTLYGIKAA
jgi:hypothetical protein